MVNGNETKIRTAEDYVFGCVNFALPQEAVDYVLGERKIQKSLNEDDLDKQTKQLLKADTYLWVCVGPSRVGSVSDSDNGWKHSEGGYTLTDDDKDRMLSYVKATYEKYGEEFLFDDSVSVTVSSFGIAPCDYNEAGIPLPHIE